MSVSLSAYRDAKGNAILDAKGNPIDDPVAAGVVPASQDHWWGTHTFTREEQADIQKQIEQRESGSKVKTSSDRDSTQDKTATGRPEDRQAGHARESHTPPVVNAPARAGGPDTSNPSAGANHGAVTTPGGASAPAGASAAATPKGYSKETEDHQKLVLQAFPEFKDTLSKQGAYGKNHDGIDGFEGDATKAAYEKAYKSCGLTPKEPGKFEFTPELEAALHKKIDQKNTALDHAVADMPMPMMASNNRRVQMDPKREQSGPSASEPSMPSSSHYHGAQAGPEHKATDPAGAEVPMAPSHARNTAGLSLNDVVKLQASVQSQAESAKQYESFTPAASATGHAKGAGKGGVGG